LAGQEDRVAGAAGTAEIAVIVVNYGTAALALEAVASVLAREHGGRAVELHLVDNASPGGDAALLEAEIAARGWQGRGVRLWAEAENHGFGRGNNLVLRHLAARAQPPRYVFLLNPDARLDNEALAILADFLDAHPEAGFAGAGIAKPGTGPEPQPVTAAFRFPSAAAEFSQALSFGPVARALAHRAVPLPADHPGGRVDWVAGAAVLARFDTLAAVEFFDPVFFLYFEEVDLMRRAADAGWQTWYVPQARVIHAEGAATEVRSGESVRRRRPAYWYHSWQHYFRKHHGRAGAALAGAAWLTGAALNHAIAALRRRPAAAPLRLGRDFWAHAGRPLAGLEPRRDE